MLDSDLDSKRVGLKKIKQDFSECGGQKKIKHFFAFNP